jgi:Cysteine-rich CPXCG
VSPGKSRGSKGGARSDKGVIVVNLRHVEIVCPYCGETITIAVDAGGGPMQRYVEDCSVCCRPIEISIEQDEEGELNVVGARADD